MFTNKMLLYAINTTKFVFTKQILKEYLLFLKQLEKVRFNDESRYGKRIPE